MKKSNRISQNGDSPRPRAQGKRSLQTTAAAAAPQVATPPKTKIARPPRPAAEWKLTAVRETAAAATLCDTPRRAADYWRDHIATAPHFTPEAEFLAVLVLNTKLHLRGHYFVSMGSLTRRSPTRAKSSVRPSWAVATPSS